MRLCIVTVYNSENCGSVLQAYALGEKLRQLGHEVVYLERDIKGTGASTSHVLRVLAKSAVTGNWKNIPLKLSFHKQCQRDTRCFKTVKRTQLQDIDGFVLGSDTIWQLNSPYFAHNMEKYWGIGLPDGKKIISYAPSIHDTPEKMLVSNKKVCVALARLAAISVRDRRTKDVLSKVTQKNIHIVCDPTMLHPIDFYQKIQRQCKYHDYILLYTFRDFCTEKQMEDIKAFAKTRGKKLISFGVYRSWCDICVPFDTFAMPAYFERADYVITNTFHGTVFSILYSKRFAAFGWNSQKVCELLKQFNLMEHMVCPSDDIEYALMMEVNQEYLQEQISRIRKSSTEYLAENLKSGE